MDSYFGSPLSQKASGLMIWPHEYDGQFTTPALEAQNCITYSDRSTPVSSAALSLFQLVCTMLDGHGRGPSICVGATTVEASRLQPTSPAFTGVCVLSLTQCTQFSQCTKREKRRRGTTPGGEKSKGGRTQCCCGHESHVSATRGQRVHHGKFHLPSYWRWVSTPSRYGNEVHRGGSGQADSWSPIQGYHFDHRTRLIRAATLSTHHTTFLPRKWEGKVNRPCKTASNSSWAILAGWSSQRRNTDSSILM